MSHCKKAWSSHDIRPDKLLELSYGIFGKSCGNTVCKPLFEREIEIVAVITLLKVYNTSSSIQIK
jgi:hypothetical protein